MWFSGKLGWAIELGGAALLWVGVLYLALNVFKELTKDCAPKNPKERTLQNVTTIPNTDAPKLGDSCPHCSEGILTLALSGKYPACPKCGREVAACMNPAADLPIPP